MPGIKNEYAMRIFIYSLGLFWPLTLFAQHAKPVIDSSCFGKWPVINSATISADGKYAAYYVEDQIAGDNLTIRDVEGAWVKTFQKAGAYWFTRNSLQAVVSTGDSLHILSLGDKNVDSIIPGRIVQQGDPWFVYKEKGSSGKIVLANLITGSTKFLEGAKEIRMNAGVQKTLVFKAATSDGRTTNLYWIDLLSGNTKEIWSGKSDITIPGSVLNKNYHQILFTTIDTSDGKMIRSLWYYCDTASRAVSIIKDGDKRILPQLFMTGDVEFTANGQWILFDLKKLPPTVIKPDPFNARVTIWNRETIDLSGKQKAQIFTAAIDTHSNHFVQLENETEVLLSKANMINGDEVIIGKNEPGAKPDRGNQFKMPKVFYAKSLSSGAKMMIPAKGFQLQNISISPHGRWLIYFDPANPGYYSFNLENGEAHALTKSLAVKFAADFVNPGIVVPVDEVAGWLEDESGALIYDNFDIWLLDPSGIKRPVAITSRWGVNHKVKLRILHSQKPAIFSFKDSLLLSGFNIKNKYNGFFWVAIGNKKNPTELSQGPYTYCVFPSQYSYAALFSDNGALPRKADSSNSWLVRRCSAMEAPNYFVTHDFIHYRAISHLTPQARYNWLSTQLISWRQDDGIRNQGVLYKPENFDSNFRYPVIINYYNGSSHRMYQFTNPDWTYDNINIPWFVSHGYLVFTPDIHFSIASKTGKTSGMAAFDAVVSGAKFLSKFSYVDSKRMAIQGHSFGGESTNYIVTHTGIFAAAVEASGITDAVYYYLSIFGTPSNVWGFSFTNDMGQEAYSASLWQRQDLYLKNSAVLNADRVTTPLMMMHNKEDFVVHWSQGVELYLALRRLNKKAWLLQYEGAGHNVEGKDAADYTIRLTQFFDHYLKGEPAPKWMIEGIPSRLQGIENRFELDSSGREP